MPKKEKVRSYRKRVRKYTNLTLFGISLIVAYVLTNWPPFQSFLWSLGALEYFGAFFAGLMFVSTFTVTTGVLLLTVLANNLPAWQIGIVAGFGAVIGDMLIFRFVRSRLIEEIEDIYEGLGGKHISSVMQTKYFSWTLPVIGALIIASPFPDELGVSLMGLSKMKTIQFLLVSFALNSLGIFLVVLGISIFKH